MPEQSPPTHTRKYTNVTFPRGFSPSQCTLLASRQRSTNYLCFSANELGELLANQNTSQKDKKTKRKKKKKVKFSKPHVTQTRHSDESRDICYENTRLQPGNMNTDSQTNRNTEHHTGLCDAKPVVPVSNPLERTTSGRFRLAKLENNLNSETTSTSNSRINSGLTGLTSSKCSSAKTSQTGQTRWMSNRDIARTLSAHVHSMLKIPPGDILREVERVERTIKFVKTKNDFPRQTPVYLFSQKPSNRQLNVRGSSAI